VITVHAQYQSRFREITSVERETFELERPMVAELAARLTGKYGPSMRALLLDADGAELNTRGTLYLNARGQRVYYEDPLEDGDTIFFMVGIAGG
jgi:molybdopterin converting factor small subunit